eukprot:gene22112-28213_t
MTFYNRGCAILSDAFVNGSYKGMDVATVPKLALRKKFVAGGHGIGLKDIIGLLFDNDGELMSDLTVLTHTPNGIPYEADDEDEPPVRYREYVLKHDKQKGHAIYQYHKAYSMDVHDSNKPRQHVTSNVRELFQSLYSKTEPDKSVPGTALLFAKKNIYDEDEARELVNDLLQASKAHAFMQDSVNFSRKHVVDEDDRHHTVLLAESESAREAMKKTITIYLYPGLKYLTVPVYSKHDNLLSFIVSARELTTNRDRIAEWGSKAKIAVGKILYHAMKLEIESLDAEAVKDVKANNLEMEPLDLLKHTLQELKCPVSYEVVRCLSDDILKAPTAKVSTVVESLIEYAEKNEPNDSSTISKDNHIALFVATKVFADFEVVKTIQDFQMLTTLIDLAKERPDEVELRSLKNPILIRGPPRVSLLFVNTSVVSTKNVLGFLERECNRVGPWTPTDTKLTEEFNDICVLDAEENSKMSVFILDLPVILFADQETEYLEERDFLVLCNDSLEDTNQHLVDEVTTLILMQTKNPEYNKRALRRKIEAKNAAIIAAAVAAAARPVTTANGLPASAAESAAVNAFVNAMESFTSPLRAPPVSTRQNIIYPLTAATQSDDDEDDNDDRDEGGDDEDSVGAMDYQDCADGANDSISAITRTTSAPETAAGDGPLWPAAA